MSANTSINQDPEEECSCELTVITLASPQTGPVTCNTAGGYSPEALAMSCNTANNNSNNKSGRINNKNKQSSAIQCGTRVHGFMSELKQVGSDLAHKINLLTDIDDELAHALSRLETQEEEIVRYRQQVYKLEADLKARNGKVKDLERKVSEQSGQSKDLVQQAMCEVEAAKCRVKQLEECLEEQKRNNCELDQRIEALKNKLRSSEKCAAYYRSLNASLDKTLESKRKIIEDLQHQTAQYLERVVEFEKSKMSSKYMDQCDVEDQLQAARMMLKEKDFEINQLWENLAVLENAVCENLSEIGVERRNFTKDTLIAQARTQQQQHNQSMNGSQQPCCKSYCNMTAMDECQQQMMMASPSSRCGGGVGVSKLGKECSSNKFEEVSKNLHHILKKITQLKQAHNNNNNMTQPALVGQGHGKTPAAVQCGSVSDFNGCSCAK